MSGPPKNTIFLERATYRQRRLRDASRLIPILGAILWSIPLLWPRGTADAPPSSAAVIYIFGVWVLMITLSALIAKLLQPDREEPSIGPPD